MYLSPFHAVLTAVVRVEDPNTRLNKFVLIGWVEPSDFDGLICFSVEKEFQNIRRAYSILISLPSQSFLRYVVIGLWTNDDRDIMYKSPQGVKRILTQIQL
jgi:hypothetical protein